MIMSEVADRIGLRMRELGLKHKDLVEGTGASKGSVSTWVNGINTPTGERLVSLAKLLKTSPEWIITGKGSDSLSERDFLTPTVVEYGVDNEFVWIDVVEANFSCGTGESIEFHFDAINGKIPFPPTFLKEKNVTEKAMKIIKAKGDSMSDFIKDGDLVGINLAQTEVVDGEIYAVYLAGEGMIKQIFKEADGSLILHSLNEKYRDKLVTEENGKNFKVMGRQIWRAG